MSTPTHPSRRLLIFQETRNPQNTTELIYLPVNKLGLPITGAGPELPSILELPLRILRAFTEIFNTPKYKGWAVLGAGPYHDGSEEGKFYAVVLEQQASPSLIVEGQMDASSMTTPAKEHLLLIFHREQNDTFTLINDPGLPISPSSGLSFPDSNGRAASGLLTMTMNPNPRLLAAVTERMGRNQGVDRGFTFLTSWTANDHAHYYVVLEKAIPVSRGNQQGSVSGFTNINNSSNDNQNNNTSDWAAPIDNTNNNLSNTGDDGWPTPLDNTDNNLSNSNTGGTGFDDWAGPIDNTTNNLNKNNNTSATDDWTNSTPASNDTNWGLPEYNPDNNDNNNDDSPWGGWATQTDNQSTQHRQERRRGMPSAKEVEDVRKWKWDSSFSDPSSSSSSASSSSSGTAKGNPNLDSWGDWGN